MTYKDHELRVIQERDDLDERFKKLCGFLKSDRPDYISDKDWYLLECQHLAMFDYLDILNKRIERFIGANNGS